MTKLLVINLINLVSVFFLISCIILIYLISGAFIEYKKIKNIHQTGIGIVLGCLIGLSIKLFDPKYEFSFDGEIFF